MTIFELVRITLDELYDQGKKQYGYDLDDEILKRIDYLSKSYEQLTFRNRVPLDYKDSATRFAYVYKYVAAHGDYLVQVMRLLRDKLASPLFAQSTARVTCVGGGPGSDIIAILKYLDENKDEEVVGKLVCYLLDKEQAWADTWTEIDESLGISVQLNANFQPLDVTNTKSWEFQQKFLQADLFTMSFFVSEVYCHNTNGDVKQFWSTIFQGANPGAFFIYIDNGTTTFNNYFDTQWKSAGLTLLISADNEAWIPRNSEQASELRPYLQKFAGHHPRLQARLSYRVLRKE